MKVWQEQQRANLERQKQQYKQFEFRNPFAGMENPFEDLTVDQQSAQFQMEQGRQQRANILASLSGAAGASGIAGQATMASMQNARMGMVGDIIGGVAQGVGNMFSLGG